MRSTAIFTILILSIGMAFGAGKDTPPYDKKQLLLTPKSDVFMQGFYWNSPPDGIWWDSLAHLAPQLASAGFGAIWFPSPVKCATGSLSMGYDPYDHFDVGEYDQIGGIPTRFGTKTQLLNSITSFHEVGVKVFCDAVMNQMNGGEEKVPVGCKPYPSYPDSDWLIFNYPRGSHRFPKDAQSFYPNSQTCDVNTPYHGASDPAFQFGVWLAKDKQSVRDSLVAWGQWLKSDIGFDGFRIDAVKNIDPNFIGYWTSHANSGAYAVAEYFGSTSEIINWLNTAKGAGGSVAMFDFPLRFTLQDICNNTSGTADMRNLDGAGLVNAGASGYDVSTFVENHDLDRVGYDGTISGSGHNPIVSDKILAYAYIMFSEGRPCVFFKDYFMYGLGRGIDSLIWIRQNCIAGGTTKRSGLNAWGIRQDGNSDQNTVGPDFYVARRDGYGSVPASYMVMNDNATQWIDVWVDTDLPVGTVLKDYTGRDANKIVTTPDHSGGKNRVKLWAPKRSFTIYGPDTTKVLNHPPAIEHIPSLVTYSNAAFSHQVNVVDVDGDGLSYSLTNTPGWISISGSGLLSGTPSFADTGTFAVIVNVQDIHGASQSDTTSIHIGYNRRPTVSAIPDTSIQVTKRYQYDASANDPDGDPLVWSLLKAPSWLTVGVSTGVISGTPGPDDFGTFPVQVQVDDNKGGLDTAAYSLTISATHDTVIATYGKPTIDGVINLGGSDWAVNWKVASDDSSDSRWHDSTGTTDNELYGLYTTWDADSLYIGIDYICNDVYNTLMLYVDAGIAGGVTNFNSTQGFKGPYPKNNRFRPGDGIDFYVADYYHDKPSAYTVVGDSAVSLGTKVHGVRGPGGKSVELAISWNDIYGLGAGLVPPHATLKIVALVAGGLNYGSGDAMPNNADVDGNAGPDSLINMVSVLADTNSDGIPDPTVFIDTVYTPVTTVTQQVPYKSGWNIVSVPYTMDDYEKSSLYPTSVSSAYLYNSGYQTSATLQNGIGYWLKFPSAQNVSFTGYERTRDTVTVKVGWNMIGASSGSIQASTIIQEPAGILISPFYLYNSGYQLSTTLTPGKGYWIKSSGTGRVILVKP